jgi:hypothetical protein
MLTPRVPDHVSHPGRCITDAYRSDSMTRPTVIRRSQRLAVANSRPGGEVPLLATLRGSEQRRLGAMALRHEAR